MNCPDLVEAGAGLAGRGDDPRCPAVLVFGSEDLQCALELDPRELGGREVVAVGLVDRDQIGELEDAALDALQLVAGAGEHEEQEEVDHLGDRGLRLADADGLDQHHVEARRLADQDRLAGLAGDAAQRAAGGGGPDEGVVDAASCSIRVLSPRIDPFETDDEGSTASTATRWPSSTSWRPKRSMKVLLPTPGTPEMPMRCAPPVSGRSAVRSCLRAIPIVGGVRLDQGDRPPERRPVVVEDTVESKPRDRKMSSLFNHQH